MLRLCAFLLWANKWPHWPTRWRLLNRSHKVQCSSPRRGRPYLFHQIRYRFLVEWILSPQHVPVSPQYLLSLLSTVNWRVREVDWLHQLKWFIFYLSPLSTLSNLVTYVNWTNSNERWRTCYSGQQPAGPIVISVTEEAAPKLWVTGPKIILYSRFNKVPYKNLIINHSPKLNSESKAVRLHSSSAPR